MKRITIVIGTRPEAIKLAPLILKLAERDDVVTSVCLTGQHTDMVQSVLEVFAIVADEDFSLMGKADSLNAMSAVLLKEFEQYLARFQPEVVVVQGDTISVLTGALAAYNQKIPVAHVEAGLRTDNLLSPWPEEGIRRMVTQIASYHFAPTKESAENVKKSGVTDSVIEVTGNTVIDALHLVDNLLTNNQLSLSLPKEVTASNNTRKVLITGHRRENFGAGLDNLCVAISTLAAEYPAVDFIFPVHLNPQVQAQVQAYFAQQKHHNVMLIAPQPYAEFIWLMKQSHFIITDSGGIQEEAPGLGKPVLVTRDTTERPEGIVAGTVRLVGTETAAIIAEAKRLLDDEVYYQQMAQAKNPYGDGRAADRIIKCLV